jgi:hypothetical protein
MSSAPWIALAAAGGFAVSTSLQHLAASRVDHSATATGLLVRLVTSRLWLLASMLGLVAFGLHAVALHLGSLALVQPLMLCGVVLAVPVRSAINRRLPHRNDFFAVSVTVLGLCVFLAATKLSPGGTAPDPRRAALLCAGVLVAYLALNLAASRQSPSLARTVLLGAAAGVLFGMMAGLIKLVAHDLDVGGLGGALSTWRPWVLAVTGMTAVSTNQRAFHSGRLAASMPILNVVNVVIAMLFGWFVFGEAPVQGPVRLVVQVLAAGITAVGLAWIARLDPEPVPGSRDTQTIGAGGAT